MSHLPLILASVALTSIGQLFFKKGMMIIGSFSSNKLPCGS